MLSRLSSVQPEIRSKRLAAVSVIIAGEERPSTLLIKRAEHSDDPWSGQIAFPGGKMGRGDGSAKETAIREAKEEVGVDLTKDAEFAGYFVPFRTHTGDMDVIPAVFLLLKEAKATPNREVSGYKWVPLDEFQNPRSASTYRFSAPGSSRDVPAYAVGDYVVWGLTHRIISSLLGQTPT
ncbi:MAG TPA: CoA pyrophosphatase [Nitrososphaerales archaeon]|nr:CoA pyrophosphatase [Nitrososphaerales archaeon]